ncbi:hypothetical protein MASR1M45_09630 [Candidatus Kapaibacterium sp.]
MIIEPQRREKRDKQIKFLIYAIVALLIVIFQISIANLIEIGGLTPNLMIVLVVWITISEGQFVGIFAGFLAGLIFDIATFDLIGTNALAQTVAAMASGFFHKEGKEELILSRYKFIGIVFFSSFLHNIVYFFLYLKLSELDFLNFFFKYGLATSFYTTVLSVFVVLFKIPRTRVRI